MVADRGAYIDQSQSFNVHIAEPNFGKLTSMHFYAWKKVVLGSGRQPTRTGQERDNTDANYILNI